MAPNPISTSSQADPETESQDTHVWLGAQLRHARLVKGLRLKDVSSKSGCSESMISKIENNKAAPSLNTLHRIAKAVGTSVGALMQDNTNDGGIVARKGHRPVIQEIAAGGLSKGGAEIEVIIPFGSSFMLQAFLVRLQPGAGSEANLQHEGEEVGYVQAGELLLTVADKPYHLKAGNSFFFASTQPHSFSNPGEETTEVIWVNTPPSL